MSNLFPPFEADEPEKPGPAQERSPRRIGPVPLRAIVPNVVTLLALAAGLTAIRLAFDGRFELAVYAILLAAVLDGLDGRIARLLKASSRFGAELDSLSDFVAFGVAPALLLFSWLLDGIKSFGWLAVLVFAIACGLRLARFNAMMDVEKPAWQSNFFTGVPAPAGAILVMLPIYLAHAGLYVPPEAAWGVLFYTLLIAFLMVSRIPTYSGKKLARIRRDWVLPLFVVIIAFVWLLASFPFHTLAAVSVAYLAAIPAGWRAFNRLALAHGAADEAVAFGDDGVLEAVTPEDAAGGPKSEADRGT